MNISTDISLISQRTIEDLERKLKGGKYKISLEEFEDNLRFTGADFERYDVSHRKENEIAFISRVRLFEKDADEQFVKKLWHSYLKKEDFYDSDVNTNTFDVEYQITINPLERKVCLRLVPQSTPPISEFLTRPQLEIFVNVLKKLKGINISVHDVLTRFTNKYCIQYTHPSFFYPDPNQITMPEITPPIDADN